MKIEIISDDRYVEDNNLSRVAWELSRSPDDETPLDTILAIDAPVNEIPSVVLGIECTIIEREIFASYRDHVMWARTSRVDDPANFDTDLYFKSTFPEELNSAKDKIKQLVKEGVIQDEYRMLMPVCAKTSFTTRISWRGLIKLYKFFEYLCDKNRYFIFAVREFDRVFDFKKYADNYSFVNPIPLLSIDEQESGKLGPIITVYQKMSIALRAQLVRHRNFTFKDNLLSIISAENMWTKCIGDDIEISISAEINFWKTVINKRQCWIAQYGIWKDIIVEAQKYLSISENDLPCSGGSCPYVRDAEIRHTDDDPGAPCPIHSNLTNTPVNSKYLESVKIEASYRPKFWEKHIEKMEITNA
jgi:hypothetical protein